MTIIIDGRTLNQQGDERERRQLGEAKRLPVIEIFGPTIQGEGAMLGYRTMFIRFGGCDYRCTKCDSLHAVIPELVKQNAVRMTINEIGLTLGNVMSNQCEWVTLSGGNPVMHDLTDLVNTGHDNGMKFALETQGSLWEDWILDCDHVTISPKGPGMGEKFEDQDFDYYMQRLHQRERVRGKAYDFSVKVVIMASMDMEFAKMIMNTWGHIIQDRMYLSLGNPFPPTTRPDGTMDTTNLNRSVLLSHYAQLVEDILQEPMFQHVKVTPQLHVLFWGNKAGV